MKKIIIEEIISQEFEVEDDISSEEVREMYKKELLVLENATVTQVNVLMSDDEEWQTIKN